MRRKFAIILLLIVLAPVAALGWMGYRLARGEQEMVRLRFHQLLTSRLRDVDATISALLEERQRAFLRDTEDLARDVALMRTYVRSRPSVAGIFMLNEKGERLHPPVKGYLTDREKRLLRQMDQVWADQDVFYQSPEADPATSAQVVTKGRRAIETRNGWYTWFWGDGAQLALWRRFYLR